ALERGDSSFLLQHCVQALWEAVRSGALSGNGHGRDFISPVVRQKLARLDLQGERPGASLTGVLAAWGDDAALARARSIAQNSTASLELRQQMLVALAAAGDSQLVETAGEILRPE